MNNIIGKKIMGFDGYKPIAGTVTSINPPQYPGEVTSYRVMCVENHEGILDEGNFTEFNKEKWILILIEWNKIMQAKLEISKEN